MIDRKRQPRGSSGRFVPRGYWARVLRGARAAARNQALGPQTRARAAADFERLMALNFARCPWSTAGECSTARERSVAGVSDEIPDCPVHGPFEEA